jgi:hypothetical protein
MAITDYVRFSNLPGVYANRPDGNLVAQTVAAAPRVLVIGTAGRGPGGIIERKLVRSIPSARSTYGTEGTLLRGMYEAKAQGGDEFLLYRMGCRRAFVYHIGDSTGAAGYTVETYMCDADAGDTYAVWYDDSADRIVVTNVNTEETIYDNDSTNPIDLNEVIVSGYRASAGGPDIGTASSPVLLKNIINANYTGTSYTAGRDGTSLSRMEHYEELYKAYKICVEEEFSVVVPMDVYLDDFNVVNQGHPLGAVAPKIPSGSTYPTAGAYAPDAGANSDVDSLGKLYVQEYLGEYYFWWDIDGDGAAEVFPSGVGSASATKNIDGTTFEAGDFHEVNFAYQLGRFLYECSVNFNDSTGVIGMLPPDSNSASDKAVWLGEEPTLTLNTITGQYYIAGAGSNGSGLLGNKFMAGQAGYRSGVPGGGFILTDSEFLDGGTEILDANDVPVDLGKFFSVVSDYALLSNGYGSTNYVASFAASYGGMYVNMPLTQAPTNQPVSNAYIYFRIRAEKLDLLAGKRYTSLRLKPRGTVIADAPSAALQTSDYTRLSTTRTVQELVNSIRDEIDPFLGKLMSDAQRRAAETAVDNVLVAAKRAGIIVSYFPFELYQTAAMRVAGEAILNLTIVPAFELRRVELNISLAASQE